MEIGLLGALGAHVVHLVLEELLLGTGVVQIQLLNSEDSHAREAVIRWHHVILVLNAQVSEETTRTSDQELPFLKKYQQCFCNQ